MSALTPTPGPAPSPDFGRGGRGVRAYPSYKPSGLPWLRHIPAHWNIKRLKFTASINPSRTEINGLPKDTEVTFLPMELVGYGDLALEQTKLLQDVQQGFTYLRNGDVIVAKITPSFENGKGAIAKSLVNGIGFGTTELHVIRPDEKLDRKFLYYITCSHIFRHVGAGMMQGTAGQKRVPDSFIINFPILLPPLPEQRTIAAYLDRQTAKIDALIAKKQRLLDLLAEQRAALISQAVTKGLPSPSRRGAGGEVRMKDSGVAWLGQVPSHWEVKKIKHVVSKIGSGKTPRGGSEIYTNEGVIFIRSQNVHFDGLRLDDVVYIDNEIDEEMHSTRVQPNDVLLNITGASLGRATVAPESLPPANVYQHVSIIRPDKGKIVPQFLNAIIGSQVVQAQIFSTENGAAREGLPYSKIANLVFAMPVELEEQKAIAEHLDYQTKRLTDLAMKVETAIARLREYRSALISSAVTGKICIKAEG